MLEDLETVRWNELSHAYGPATDIPDLIRAVASADKATRRKAWHSLYGNLWHQGTIYEATAYAVPFFIELAGNERVPEREEVLGYLVNLAEGTSYNDVHQHAEMFAARRNTPEFQQQRETELGWVTAVREAVRNGRHIYADLLNDESPLIRTTTAHLLARFPGDASEHIAWIQAHITAGEVDDKARTWCVLSVGRLAIHDRSAAPWLRGILDTDASEAVRIAAALALAWSIGRSLPQNALHLIAQNARHPGPAAALFERTPWYEDEERLQYYCSEALGLLRDVSDDSFDTLIKAINDVADYQAIDIMRSLLTRVLLGKPMPRTMTVDRLTAEQHMVLQAIATSERIWHDLSGRVHVTPVIRIMGEFGLPRNVKRLQAFLEGRITPQDSDWSNAILEPAMSPAQMAELRKLIATGAERLKKSKRDGSAD